MKIKNRWKIRLVLEALGWLTFLVGANISIFSLSLPIGSLGFLRVCMLLFLISVMSYRFGFVGSFLAVGVTLAIAIVWTIYGFGPFSNGDPNQIFLHLIIFASIIFTIAMIVATAIKESRRAIEDSRRNEQRFRSLVENSADMVALLDPTAKIIYASTSTTKVLGYKIDEYVNRNLFDFIHPDDAEAIRTTLLKIIDNPQKTFYASCRFLDSQDRWRWLEGSGTNLLADPNVKAIVTNYRDITQKKQAQDDQAYLVSIIENSDDAIFSKTLEGIITSWNEGARKLYGYNTSEMIGKSVDILVPEGKKKELDAILAQVKQGNKASILETIRKRKDGQLIQISVVVSPIKDNFGRLIGVSSIARDISERKKYELALAESELRFRRMADTAPVMIWVSGNDALCNFFNLRWLEFTGQTLEHELGDGWIQGVYPDDLDRCLDIYRNAFKNYQRFTMDYRLRRYDGEYRWILDTGIPRFTKDGQLEGYIGSCIDITERKLAEDILKRDAQMLQMLVDKRSAELFNTQRILKQRARLADIGTLAATVAHELRNPLGVIQMAVYNLKGKRSDLSGNKHLLNIEKKTLEGSQIINNLLSYSNIKIPSYQQVKILSVLEECISTADTQFQYKNVLVKRNFDIAQNYIIEADPFQLVEIFTNIIMNAYQSLSPPLGKLEVSVTIESKKFIKLVFCDNGSGIDKEDLGKVFVPFFTKKSKGTGLGLAIVNELVDLHGGSIEITSEKNIGTSVSVVLPIKQTNGDAQLHTDY